MKKSLALILVAAMLLLTACSPAPEPEPEPGSAPTWEVSTPEPTVEPTPEPTEEPTPTPEPTPDPSVSLTTGIATATGEAANYRPLMLMIENSNAARPQTGMQQADIVYECLAESAVTRFICLFNDQYPIVAGPVRSTRIYFLNIQKEWDAIMCHYGGPSDAGRESYVYGNNTDYIKVRIDGLSGGGGKYYWRSSERKAPHNVYSNLQTIVDENFNYTPNEREHFSFDASVSYEGETISSISMPFISSTVQVEYRYDEATGKLLRWNHGDEFMIRTVTLDENGKEQTETAQLSVQNLIVQYTDVYVLSNDSSGRRNMTLVGSGKCDYVIGGKHVTGTWERASLDESTRYLLDDGTPVTLMPGNTWIAVHPDSVQATVTY